jgi:predicted nucleic acid-binding protein
VPDERSLVLDPDAAIAFVASGRPVPGGVKLLAPALLRSQVLSRLHESVRSGDLDHKEARRLFEAVNELPMRLLGDRVLRLTAWKIAAELGWPDTYRAEYVALTTLWGDALVTSDAEVIRAVAGLIETAPLSDLLG